jgi:hypothetical protein
LSLVVAITGQPFSDNGGRVRFHVRIYIALTVDYKIKHTCSSKYFNSSFFTNLLFFLK